MTDGLCKTNRSFVRTGERWHISDSTEDSLKKLNLM
jgi:hypothetical protein